jgi:Domain of unknown function (DUF4349)
VWLCLALGTFSAGCGAKATQAVASPAEAKAMSAPPAPPGGAAVAPESHLAEQVGGRIVAPSPALAKATEAPARPSLGSASPAKAKTGDGPKLDDAAKPLLIYEGALGMEVTKSDIPSTIERTIDIAEKLGGYLVSRNDQNVQVRVPSGAFRDAMKQIGALGSVTRRSVGAQDVSEEHHDLGIRLKNLESVRNRLEQFLARATNVDEALRVGKELEAIVLQIDQIKGRMQYLETRASYSLVNLTLAAKPEPSIVAKTEGKVTPPAPRTLRMPVSWLHRVGLEQLLDLEAEN